MRMDADASALGDDEPPGPVPEGKLKSNCTRVTGGSFNKGESNHET